MMNRLKLGVMVCLAVFALVYVSEVRATEIGEKTNVAGTWAAQGQWQSGGGTWHDTWTITQKKKKITGHADGYDFKGKVKGSAINFQIQAGCYPNYTGTVNGNTMGGTMQCTQGSGSGTWSATKTGEAQESSGASAAGPGE